MLYIHFYLNWATPHLANTKKKYLFIKMIKFHIFLQINYDSLARKKGNK